MTTQKDLARLCQRINVACGNPVDPIEPNPSGKGYRWIVGCYHVSSAYGGVCLEKITSEGGGTTDIFSVGYVSKSVLERLMQAYLQGIETGKGLK